MDIGEHSRRIEGARGYFPTQEACGDPGHTRLHLLVYVIPQIVPC